MITEDTSIYFNDKGMTTLGKYTPQAYPHPSSKTIDVYGIFDNEYEEILNANTSAPIFTCSLNDITDPVSGDKIRINNVDYVIKDPQQNEADNIVSLILQKI